MGCNKILYISKFWKINLFCITTVLWFHSKQTRAILKNKFMIFYPDEENIIIIVIVDFFKNCINFRDKNVSFEEHHWMASSKFIIDFNKIFSIKEIKDDSLSNAIKRLSWTFYAPWQVAMISISYWVHEMKVSFILISRGSLGGASVLKWWTPQLFRHTKLDSILVFVLWIVSNPYVSVLIIYS